MLVHIQKKIKMIKFKFQKTLIWGLDSYLCLAYYEIKYNYSTLIKVEPFLFSYHHFVFEVSQVLFSSSVSHFTVLHAKMEMGRLTAWYGWLNICVHVSNHYCKFRSHIYMREYVVFIFCAWIISLDTTMSMFVWFSANVRISFFFS